MDMALEYSVMDDIFDTMSNDLMDDEYYPANESEFGDYQSTRRNFGSKVIGLIRSIFERIIAAIRKLAAWVYNFFKHIKEGAAAVRAANAASELKIELDRIFNIAYNQAKNIVNEVKSYGILGVKQGEKIAKKAEKQAAKNNGTVNVDSVAPKVNELCNKVDGANARYAKLQDYIRTASQAAAKKAVNGVALRDVVREVTAKIKLKCEADIKSYLDTAAKQYEELNKKLSENAVDVEGAKALATLNAKVNEVLRKIVNLGAGASGEGGNGGGAESAPAASGEGGVAKKVSGKEGKAVAKQFLSKDKSLKEYRDLTRGDSRIDAPQGLRSGEYLITSGPNAGARGSVHNPIDPKNPSYRINKQGERYERHIRRGPDKGMTWKDYLSRERAKGKSDSQIAEDFAAQEQVISDNEVFEFLSVNTDWTFESALDFLENM